MTTYSVICYSRQVGAIGVHGTDINRVRVVADSPEQARHAAIDEHYRLHPRLEHVNPRTVFEVVPC